MRLLAGLLLLAAIAGCADLRRMFPLDRYEPWKKEQGR